MRRHPAGYGPGDATSLLLSARGLWLAACAALAVVSLALSPTPHYDPFAWLTWGREIAHLDMARTLSGPSWKPLPVLITIPLSLLGGVAPAAWLLVARTAGLLGFVFAYRAGRRLHSPGAGVLAAVALLFIPGFFREMALGGELSLLVPLVLAAVERHLAGRPAQAVVLAFAAALLRSEMWPFLGLYGAWAGHARAVDRRLVAVLFLSVPVLWFVPDWVTLGDPLHGAEVARASTEARTPALVERPLLEVTYRGYRLLPEPLHVLAVVGVALAVRGGQRVVGVLAAAALGWVLLVAVMTAVGGYPGLSRFLVPAAAVVCLLAAVGAARLVHAAGARWGIAVAGLLALALMPAAATSAGVIRDEVGMGLDWARVAGDLPVAVRAAGGAEPVACRRPVINHAAQTELAWLLKLPIAGVRTRGDGAGMVFSTDDPIANVAPQVPADLHRRLVGRTDEWTVYELGAAPPARGAARCPQRS